MSTTTSSKALQRALTRIQTGTSAGWDTPWAPLTELLEWCEPADVIVIAGDLPTKAKVVDRWMAWFAEQRVLTMAVRIGGADTTIKYRPGLVEVAMPGGTTVPDLVDAVESHGPRVLFVDDFLGLESEDDWQGSRAEQRCEVLRELHYMARKHNVAVFILARAETDTAERLSVWDVEDGPQLEGIPAKLLAVRPYPGDEDEVEFVVLKNRTGPCGEAHARVS